jgi:hypothetical protein
MMAAASHSLYSTGTLYGQQCGAIAIVAVFDVAAAAAARSWVFNTNHDKQDACLVHPAAAWVLMEALTTPSALY